MSVELCGGPGRRHGAGHGDGWVRPEKALPLLGACTVACCLFGLSDTVFASQESPEGRRGEGNVTPRRKKNVATVCGADVRESPETLR